MINLLPPEDKEQLKKEESFRLILILGMLSVLFFVCLSLLLLSIRIYVGGGIAAQNILIEAEKKQEQESPLQKIRLLNGDIKELERFYAQETVLSDIILRITTAVPERVYITSFSYTPPIRPKGGKEITNARVSLTGFGPTREDLLAFRAKLEEDALFENFNFPQSNWKLAEDIDFSFTFEIKPL